MGSAFRSSWPLAAVLVLAGLVATAATQGAALIAVNSQGTPLYGNANTVQVTNNGTYDFGRVRGLVYVDGFVGGEIAVFLVANATVTEVSDPGGLFTTTQGTASSTNVYWNAGTNSFRIENKRGSTYNYGVTVIGTAE